MHPRRRTAGRAIGLVMLAALVVLVTSACGGGEQESKARAIPEDEKALRPGQYRSEEFEPSLSFRVGEGWSSTPMEASDLLHIPRGGEAGLGFVVPHRVYQPSKSGTPNAVEAPKDLVGWYRRHPYLRTTEPKPATLGGLEGVRFDVSVVEELPEVHRRVCGTGCVGTVKVADGRVLWQQRVERTCLIVLEDVQDETVTVAIHGRAAGFDEFVPEAQKVVDSVEWTGFSAPGYRIALPVVSGWCQKFLVYASLVLCCRSDAQGCVDTAFLLACLANIVPSKHWCVP